MIWAVLDTDVLVSGIGWPGTPAQVVDAAVAGRFVLVSSESLLSELDYVLGYPKLAKVIKQRGKLVDLIRNVSIVVQPDARLRVLRDEADNRVLEAALAANADVIVAGDMDLLAIAAFETIRVVNPRDFMELLDESCAEL